MALPRAAPAEQSSLGQSSPGQSLAMQGYRETAPYVALPLARLKKDVRELSGVKPDSTPGQLELILQKTGEAITAQLPKVPNLICHEAVAEEAQNTGGTLGGLAPVPTRAIGAVGGRGLLTQAAPSTRPMTYGDWHHYDYIIRVTTNRDGSITLDEMRQRKGTGAVPVPKGTGFAPLWRIFAPGNRSESSFYYLGTGKMEGHSSFVVAFAQRPGQVREPSLFQTCCQTIPLLFQGIAWIDAHNFHIVRLRTDLLAPLPELSLARLTSNIEYGEVHIPDLAQPLWLPKEVEVLWQTNHQDEGEVHRYSRYQLFRATAKISP
jgi:hypothetical protein